MKSDCESQQSQIARDVLAYLSENPDAQDTLAGIVEWWLLEAQIKYRTESVKRALAQLVEEGLIIEKAGKDSQPHYRINANKSQEIIALLGRA